MLRDAPVRVDKPLDILKSRNDALFAWSSPRVFLRGQFHAKLSQQLFVFRKVSH
jgi:hypothetical protein